MRRRGLTSRTIVSSKHLDAQGEGFVDVELGVGGAGQIFLEHLQPEAVVDALQEDAAQLEIALDDQNVFGAVLAGGDGGRQPARAAADDDHVVFGFARHLPSSHMLWSWSAQQETGAAALLGHFQWRDAQFAGENIHHARHIETAQAAPGAQPGAPFERVIGAGRDGGVDLGDDFAFGDQLAAADDARVAWIVGDEHGLFLAAKTGKTRARRANGVPVRLLAQRFAGLFEQLDHALSDGGRGGEAGGFDAAQVDQALGRGGNFDDKVVPVIHARCFAMSVAVGAQPGEHGDDVAQIERRDHLERAQANLLQPFGGGGAIVLVRNVVGGGAAKRVAVQRSRHQDAFADFGRHGEEHVVDRDFSLVEDHVLAAARGDGEIRAHAGAVHHLVGEEPGSVDRPAAAEITAAGLDAKDAPAVVEDEILESGGSEHLRAVLDGIFRGGDGHGEGVAQPAGGRPQRAADLRVDVGLAVAHLLAGDEVHARHAVLASLLEQAVELEQLEGPDGDDVISAALEGEIQLAGQVVPQRVGGHVHFGLERAGEGVIAGMHDGRVGRAGAHADISFFFDQQDAELVAR